VEGVAQATPARMLLVKQMAMSLLNVFMCRTFLG